MSQNEAAALARQVLGRRARAFRDNGQCVIGRHEMLMCGMAHTKVFGVGPTWSAAVEAAVVAYAQMRHNPIQGVRQNDE